MPLRWICRPMTRTNPIGSLDALSESIAERDGETGPRHERRHVRPKGGRSAITSRMGAAYRAQRERGAGQFPPAAQRRILRQPLQGHGGCARRTDSPSKLGDRPHFATQSGPMLVIDGELHPAFDTDGDSARSATRWASIRRPRAFRHQRGTGQLRQARALFSRRAEGEQCAVPRWQRVRDVGSGTGRLDTGASIGPLIIVTDRETEQ